MMKGFKNILYVSEHGIDQEAALARAVSLAHSNQAQLTLMDVVPEQTVGTDMPLNGQLPVDLTDQLLAQRRQHLASLLAAHATAQTTRIEVHVGITFIEVIRAVLRQHFDLVIKPAENPDWIERLFGSVDMHLLRKCPCPVWLMKPQEKASYACIVAAIDFDPDHWDGATQALNQQILNLAASLSAPDLTQWHVVHAWDTPAAGFVRLWADDPDQVEMHMLEGERARHTRGMNRLLESFRLHIGEEAYTHLAPQVHLPMGSARKVIAALAKELQADLVVMGTAARTGIPGFLIGNTAESILDQLQCSVLAIKPAGFVTPVMID